MEPIFELEIVNEIMQVIHKENVSFYQRELSYQHCDVVNMLEKKASDDEVVSRIQSLPFCNGNYLIPLLNQLKDQAPMYFVIAKQVIIHKFYTEYKPKTACPKGSFLEQIFSWMEQYIQLYKERENQNMDESQLQAIFDMRLSALLNEHQEKTKGKNKSYQPI